MLRPNFATAAAAMMMMVGLAHGHTLEDVTARGYVQCGVADGTQGFSVRGSNNEWTGFDVDFCRAVAAAIFDDPQKVRFTATTTENRWKTLSSGEVDILARTTTWTMGRDTAQGVRFAGTTYYDGQGFLVRVASAITSASALSGLAVCLEAGTTSVLNLADYFATSGMELVPMVYPSQPEAYKAYEDGACTALSSDRSALAAGRLDLLNPDEHIVLPEVISKEPLAVAVRAGEDDWFNVVRWVYFALLNAEELDVSATNVDDMTGSSDPGIKRLLGVEGDFGTPMGLTKSWAYQVIKRVGNYGEIFARNLGSDSPVGLERGANALWNAGGLHYAPPIR